MDMTGLIKRFLKCESGATAIEYGLIAMGIALAIAVTVALVGTDLDTIFVQIQGLFAI